MNDHDNEQPSADNTPSQADLYDDLQRIGELEDQKAAVQKEIDERTERLKQAIPHLDKGSLLHQMLSATLKPKAPASPKRSAKTAKRASKKSTRK